jgi:hypothetical protein
VILSISLLARHCLIWFDGTVATIPDSM